MAMGPKLSISLVQLLLSIGSGQRTRIHSFSREPQNTCNNIDSPCNSDEDCTTYACSGGWSQGTDCTGAGRGDDSVCRDAYRCDGGYNRGKICVAENPNYCRVGTCHGRSNNYQGPCKRDSDCGGSQCRGGANDGNPCTTSADCSVRPDAASVCMGGTRHGLVCQRDDGDFYTGCPDKTTGLYPLRVGTCVFDGGFCVPSGVCRGAAMGECGVASEGICQSSPGMCSGNHTLPWLETSGNNGDSVFPLGECKGDCDADDDCKGTLICYERFQNETVPGCAGAGNFREDYCAYRPRNYLRYVGGDGIPEDKWPLGLCEGDCDSDDDCRGTLICEQRKGTRGWAVVPGCIGNGKKSADYCRLADPWGNTSSPTPDPTPGPTPLPTPLPTPDPTPPITAHPTKTPTYQPTSSPVAPQTELVNIGNNGKPAAAFPLKACQGECDNDDECEGLLVCYQRYQEEAVPGCFGLGDWGDDYCADRPANYLFYVGNDLGPGALNLCEGDCDDDANCAGDLICELRNEYTPVPGCDGTGRRSTDYCRHADLSGPTKPADPWGNTSSPTPDPTPEPTPLPTPLPTPDPTPPITANPTKTPTYQPTSSPVAPQTELVNIGNNGKPAAAFPLKACQGECDNDDECEGLLVCYQRYQEEAVPGCFGLGDWGDDYCADRPANYLFYVGNDLGPGALNLCEGNCDDDANCAGDLICELRNEYTPVPGCDGTGMRSTDYCRHADPSGPTKPPTTGQPTPQPTPYPIGVGDVLLCPPVGSPMATVSSGLKAVTLATGNMFCGIFLRKQSGDLIPLARSYKGEGWEAAPGPLARLIEDVHATSILLPSLEDPNDDYVILSKDGTMEERKQIAMFLEMITFGPKMSEIDSLDDGTWSSNGANRRAQYIRQQMDLPVTSHREYWRQRTNSKWDATARPARSSHPCSSNSKWRKYTYTRQDRFNTVRGKDYTHTTFEIVPEEAHLSATIYEADRARDFSDRGDGTFGNSLTGHSGRGYYKFAKEINDFIEFTVELGNMAKRGTHPISFRYGNGSPLYNGNRPCQLWVNGNMIEAVYDFDYTDNWNYWKYSELVDATFGVGLNTIKLVLADQLGGPNIDHLRIGKPPAVVMKTNGWPRAIAKNGIHLLDAWPFDFTDGVSVTFDLYPDPPTGYLNKNGRIRVTLSDDNDYFLDIGNPPIDFTGYEQYLPPYMFTFTASDVFEETASDLFPYPMQKGQELLLRNGSTNPVCDNVPPFAEKFDAPIIGQLPSGEWIQWSPTIMFEDNGPSVNTPPGDLTAAVLSDGGGGMVIQTGEKLKCSNVQRSFVNEDTCFLSTESTACSASQPVDEVLIPLNTSNIMAFNDLANKYVYAIRGLVMENLDEHACKKKKSRWEVKLGSTCSAPTALRTKTITALEDAIVSSSDSNPFVKDVTRSLLCNFRDVKAGKINIQIQVGSDCYTHVHPNHLNVYDFSGWVTKHPGGKCNIQKWAQGWQWHERWYLDYDDVQRGNPEHPMRCWYRLPNVVYVTRLGDSIAFRDLPHDLKTNAAAQYFGASPQSVADGGVIVCGSIGEVSNDPALPETFDVYSNERTTLPRDELDNQKHVVWTQAALYSDDQLRQRMAWALAQIVTTVPGNIGGGELTEIYTKYYDIFVTHAFGNYRDILAEASFSPLMAEHLTFLESKSHSYVYQDEEKRVSRADENYAREIMQLFSIGLIVLHDDGTQVLEPASGKPLETYTEEEIESFARAWTGFDRTGVRSNYEDILTGTSDNRLDPLRIIPDWRDPFPKSNLKGGFIGDRYLLCKDLPTQSFLKKGAGYRLLGGKSSPELMKDPTFFAEDATNGILRVELDSTSDLYQRLYNGGNHELFVELDHDLACNPGTVECDIDTLRVVKVGSIYYEFVERPCVQMAFYDNGKQIQLRDHVHQGQMCANADLAHAREACCRADRVEEVRDAMMETGVTYLYEGERMTYDTAKNRCVAYGRDLCLYGAVSIAPKDNHERKGYHWTNKDCSINVKVNSVGYIAIVHDSVSTYDDTIPWMVEEENTLNWFRVFWNGGSYPGDTKRNTCEDNDCKTMIDGSCLCKTTVAESVVFSSLANISKEDVLSQLFMGVLGPQYGSTTTDISDDLTVHMVGGIADGNTVFEVQEKGRTMYLKNMLSTVNLGGWTMSPQIYEAEDANVSNARVKDNTDSATGGLYVGAFSGDETSSVEWNVNIPNSGKYLIYLRYANDDSPRPLSVFINTHEIFRQPVNPNPTIPFNNVADTTSAGSVPLQRCEGDCNIDGECDDGLFCMNNRNYESVPGCTGSQNKRDYCVDINDFDYGFTLLPTGGWNNNWHYSDPLEVDLSAGQNTIRIQLPPLYTRGPNVDHLKIEGLPTSTSLSSFRNPPHFMSLITDYYHSSSPGGLGEQNLRDAQYETDAVLDHYFYRDNVAPFMCIRIMQRFSFSNPSPRFVASCVEAFRTGVYTSGLETFGSGEYGSLEAMAASIILDKEATEDAITSDPSHGSVREPILKVTNLMRSMDYQTSIPTSLVGAPMQTTHNVKLWQIDTKIGQGPYEFPTVFSFFLPEYVPDSGPNLTAKLTSPESMGLTMPNVVLLLNGLFSMIKYGLSDCNDGFSTNPGYGDCNDDGLYERSYGHLFYEPSGADEYEKAADLALLLTGGRLSEDNLNIIVDACSSGPDQLSKTRCMQQLIVTTGEFHTTNPVTQSGEDEVIRPRSRTSAEPYKAIVYFFLAGGLDSYNMLVPYTCAPIDVYGRYKKIRGSVGLRLSRLLKIKANNPAQPCSSFGIHKKLPALKQLYDNGKLNFVANAGLLAKPVTVDNYRGETPVQLGAHNAMALEAQMDDLATEISGTGIGGRMADVLTQAGIPTDTFSIDGHQVLLTGEAGEGPGQSVLRGDGVPEFNTDPSIDNMDDVITRLNKGTTADSGFFAKTWSYKLSEALAKQQLLKQEVDATVVTTTFPDSSTAEEFEMVTRIMQTREARGSKRDIFFVEDSGYDTHSNVHEKLIMNFSRINGAIQAFVNELEVLGLWESTVVVQFSEFARTLDPNTGHGTDHAWGGHHFMFGGAVNGGHILGQYPSDFEQGDAEGLVLSRGRMIPTTPWDAMWKGTAEWFGIPANGPGMDKVLPMHRNFPTSSLFSEADLFNPSTAAASSRLFGRYESSN